MIEGQWESVNIAGPCESVAGHSGGHGRDVSTGDAGHLELVVGKAGQGRDRAVVAVTLPDRRQTGGEAGERAAGRGERIGNGGHDGSWI